MVRQGPKIPKFLYGLACKLVPFYSDIYNKFPKFIKRKILTAFSFNIVKYFSSQNKLNGWEKLSPGASFETKICRINLCHTSMSLYVIQHKMSYKVE
jgi:hypothetical protein